jgi:hypothetical protein
MKKSCNIAKLSQVVLLLLLLLLLMSHEAGGCFFPLMHVSFRADPVDSFFLGGFNNGFFLVDKNGTIIITSNWDWCHKRTS